jgi:hypothetical protein
VSSLRATFDIVPDIYREGDADGLGETRKKELVKSGMSLGLRNEDDVFVVESAYAALLCVY